MVVSGPSGAGKTTIAREVQDRLDGVFSISATTRPRSGQETDGRDYHFVTDEQFRAMIDRGEFLEYAEVFGRYGYGTPRRPVEEHLSAGCLVVLDIDVQGGLQIRNNRPDALLIFILPPSDEELLRRLRTRGRDDEEAVQRRFAEAKREIDLARSSGAYDAFVVNDELAEAIERTIDLVQRRRAGDEGGGR
ncbi:MAG: guanylate kinase [Phycisphaerales bacterium]|nr:MAG: guanylate kinase [Phycisphaerales bacterium]